MVSQLETDQIKDGTLTSADFDSGYIDGGQAIPSLRTIGTGSSQACAGDDERLSKSYLYRRLLEAFPDANDFTWQQRGWKTTPTFDAFDAALAAPTTRPYARVTTAGTSGSAGGIKPTNYGGNGESVRTEWFPEFVHSIGTRSVVTSYRFWAGFTSASLDAVGTPTTQHVAAFRYDTGVDGTAFWRCITCDGASNVTTTTTSVAIATSTFYDLRIRCKDASNIEFWINGNLIVTHKTNLPSSTTLLSPVSRVVTLTNQARQAYFSDLRVAHN